MSRVILIYPHDININLIKEHIVQCELGIQIIIKILPANNNNNLNLYAYNRGEHSILIQYQHLYDLLEEFKEHYDFLFNIELSYNNIEVFFSFFNQEHTTKLPIFIDYFYTNGDTLLFEHIEALKQYSRRIDFNHVFSNENTTASISNINDITSICDNYDQYYIESKDETNFIAWYLQKNSIMQNKHIEIENFLDLLNNYHSATPIYFYNNGLFNLYLYGYNRFYDIHKTSSTILSHIDFLKQTIIYLNKKMNKTSLCMDCIYKNQCFISGLWLQHNHDKEQCKIIPILEKHNNETY